MTAIGSVSSQSVSLSQASLSPAAGGGMVPGLTAQPGGGMGGVANATATDSVSFSSQSLSGQRRESVLMSAEHSMMSLGMAEPSDAVNDMIQLLVVMLILEALMGKDDEESKSTEALMGMMMLGMSGQQGMAVSSTSTVSMTMTSQSMDLVSGAYGLSVQPAAAGSFNVMA